MHLLLEVAIQVLVRVELRGVSGQKEHLDPFPPLVQPGLDPLAVMHTLVVQNQEDLTPLGVPNQPPPEADQHGRRHGFPIQHEAQLAPLGHRRIMFEAKRLPLTSRTGVRPAGAAASRMTITAQAGFIASVNLAALGLGAPLDLRVLGLQPALYRLGLLLIGALQWSLRGITPTLEIFADRSDRHLKTTVQSDQGLYCIPHPERESELQLVWNPQAPTEPRIQVIISPILDGATDFTASSSIDQAERKPIYIGVGQLPLIAIGSHWQHCSRRPSAAGKLYAFVNLTISPTKVRPVKSNAFVDEDFLIRKSYHQIGAGLSANCLAIE